MLICLICRQFIHPQDPEALLIIQPYTNEIRCAYCPVCRQEGANWDVIRQRAKAWLAAYDRAHNTDPAAILGWFWSNKT